VQRGDMTQVRRQITRAEELLRRSPESRPHSLDIDIVWADLDLGEGRLAAARQSYGELRLRISEEIDLMRIDTRLGLLAHLEHDDEEALRHLQRVDESKRSGLKPGEQGLYLFTLARVLRTLGREPERATTLAEEAIAAYSTAGAQYMEKVAEIRAWRTAERVDPSRVDPG
jgi:tetratricopeptide (TPR) repeat protein